MSLPIISFSSFILMVEDFVWLNIFSVENAINNIKPVINSTKEKLFDRLVNVSHRDVSLFPVSLFL